MPGSDEKGAGRSGSFVVRYLKSMKTHNNSSSAGSAEPAKTYLLWMCFGVVVGCIVPLIFGIWLHGEFCPDSTCGAAAFMWFVISLPLFIVGVCTCLYGSKVHQKNRKVV